MRRECWVTPSSTLRKVQFNEMSRSMPVSGAVSTASSTAPSAPVCLPIDADLDRCTRAVLLPDRRHRSRPGRRQRAARRRPPSQRLATCGPLGTVRYVYRDEFAGHAVDGARVLAPRCRFGPPASRPGCADRVSASATSSRSRSGCDEAGPGSVLIHRQGRGTRGDGCLKQLLVEGEVCVDHSLR